MQYVSNPTDYPYLGSVFFFSLTQTLGDRLTEELGRKFAESQKVDSCYAFRTLTNDKFCSLKLFGVFQNYLLVIDGAILNSQTLINRYATSNLGEALVAAYKVAGDLFVMDVEGEFSLILYDIEQKKVKAYASHSGTKPLYCYQQNDILLIGSDVYTLVRIIRGFGKSLTLHEDATYCFLTFGHLLADLTLTNEIVRIEAGYYLTHSSAESTHKGYYIPEQFEKVTDSSDTVLKEVRHRFETGVKKSYQLDLDYGYRHLGQLSGGLDSRMNVMVADALGFKNQTLCSFGVKNSWDAHIAREVSESISASFKYVPLSAEDYGHHILEPILMSNCQVYNAAAHTYYANKQLDFDNFGFLHAGQVGDTVIGGSLFQHPENMRPDLNKFRHFSETYMPRVVETLAHKLDKYQSHNYAHYDFIVNNYTISGNWIINHFSDMISPFQYKPLHQYAMAVSADERAKHKLYFRWMDKYYPQAGSYRHQATMRRTRPYNARVLNSLRYRYDSWYIKHNPQLSKAMLPTDKELLSTPVVQARFAEIISRFDGACLDEVIKRDVLERYKNGSDLEKQFAVSFCLIYNLLFEN